jgi:hypothetical protein
VPTAFESQQETDSYFDTEHFAFQT